MQFRGTVFRYGRDVDTDVIIPARYLNTSDPSELAEHCLEDLDATFVSRVRPGDIIVAEENFGCGSSREHAPWALADYGFKTMIAPSFADIFYGNAINNGMVPVRLKEEEVDALFQLVAAQPGIEIEVDLEANQVRAGSLTFGFEIDEFRRYCLLNGLDAIGLTLQHEAAISAFEAKQPSWI